MKNKQSPETGSVKAEIIRSAILAGFLLVLVILAINDNTPYPGSIPQNRYWTDSIVDFFASYKEAAAVILVILFGLYRFFPARTSSSLPEDGLKKGSGISRALLVRMIWTGVWAVLIPWLSFVFVEAYNKGYWHVGARVSYENAAPMNSMFLLNMLLYYLFFLSLTFLLGSFETGYCTAAAILMGVAIVNYYVQEFRGSPIVPWDFLSVRTAANVAGDFQYKIYWQMLLATFGFVFLLLTAGKMRAKLRFLPVRIAGFAIAAAALVFVVHSLQNDETKSFWGLDTTLFTPNVRYTKNGFWPAFLANLSFLNIEKPDGYSTDRVEEIAREAAQEYQKEALFGTNAGSSAGSGRAVTAQNPNIIVIMNEAFSDLSVLGDFRTNEDYMPNFRSLMEKYTSGHLMVSVKGGNTANTEYEFLSGDTMAFLPQGSVVYQQYISGGIPTIATFLGSLGYETIGMHPYLGSGWERNRVYPLMGFDVFLDQNDFKGADKLRNYVSDKGAFDKVIELFEGKEKGRSQFQFLVTMQNHSGYSPKDTDNGFSEEILLMDAPAQTGPVVAAERYLTLIKYSDRAFQDLIDYFEENVTEPTMIVMFGDHEPNDYVTEVIDDLVGNESYATSSDNSGASGETQENLEDIQKHYQVPFVIWNNFGVKKDDSLDLTSVNYLASILLEEAGIELSDYCRFERNMQKKIPALAAGAWTDADGTYHSWADRDKEEPYSTLINNYNILEYNHLIDTKGRQENVFLPEKPS